MMDPSLPVLSEEEKNEASETSIKGKSADSADYHQSSIME